MVFITLLMLCIIIKFFLFHRKPAPTAAGAIVMAIGIFEYDAFNNFFLFNTAGKKYIAFLLAIIWLFIISSYAKSLFNHSLRKMHFQNEIKSFAIGTWVAGTSVCSTIIYNQFSELQVVSKIIMIANGLFWAYFIYICIRNFKKLMKKDFFINAHGIILLSTVSTQSLVVGFTNIFRDNYYIHMINECLFFLGVGFYILSLMIIINRYFTSYKTLDIKVDWYNTNCVIHGAMSITGLAGVISHTIPANVTILMWYWVLAWFILIEFIEIYRACVRLNQMGLINGLLKYDVSQWTRNFTFGMLFAFTLKLPTNEMPQFFIIIHQFILHYGVVVVLVLLLCEMILFLKENMTLKYLTLVSSSDTTQKEKYISK